MAITAATLTSIIEEQYIQEGQSVNGKTTATITALNYYDKRVAEIPTTEMSWLDFAAAGTAIGPGKLLAAKVRYLRVTNHDSTNFLRIGFKKTGAATYWVVVQPTKSFILMDLQYDANSAGGAFSALVYPDTMLAKSDTAVVKASYFIAQAD
jgi:hypothetical protein